jgi:uncharacterized protein with FMN-binding domain
MLEQLKKVVLSVSVVVLFALYALQRQTQTSDPPPAVAQRAPVTIGTATRTPAGQKAFATIAAPTPTATATETRTPARTLPGQADVGVPGLATKTAVASGRPTSTATSEPTATATATAEFASSGAFRDGTYSGDVADANWGNVEVQAVVTNGQLSDVQFQEFPNHRSRSRSINQRAMPILIQEAIQSQSAEVDVVSGATDTSEAFIESLGSALSQAGT